MKKKGCLTNCNRNVLEVLLKKTNAVWKEV